MSIVKWICPHCNTENKNTKEYLEVSYGDCNNCENLSDVKLNSNGVVTVEKV